MARVGELHPAAVDGELHRGKAARAGELHPAPRTAADELHPAVVTGARGRAPPRQSGTRESEFHPTPRTAVSELHPAAIDGAAKQHVRASSTPTPLWLARTWPAPPVPTAGTVELQPPPP
jgi:hypothetical protein